MKPPLLRQSNIYLDFLDDSSVNISYDLLEHDCPSCYMSFDTDIELSEHVVLTDCFLEKLRKEKESHQLEIESIKFEHNNTIIRYLLRIKYLEEYLEWFQNLFKQIKDYVQFL